MNLAVFTTVNHILRNFSPWRGNKIRLKKNKHLLVISGSHSCI